MNTVTDISRFESPVWSRFFRRAESALRRAARLPALVLGAIGTAGPSHAQTAEATIRPEASPPHEIVLLVGAPGEPQFDGAFSAAIEAWRAAAKAAKARLFVIGGDESSSRDAPTDRARLQEVLTQLSPQTPAPAWFVYIGHGTFDRRGAWLNLRGPDVSSAEIVDWLKPLGARELIVVHGGSAAGPFLPALSAKKRIVITATRSGDEVNYARFGERFALAVVSPDADIDQDGSTSLLEAFLLAAKKAQADYTENGRMPTEHPLIDDNGDQLGTPPEWFQGVRVVKRADNQNAAPDGFRARQIALLETPRGVALSLEERQERDRLEAELESIRSRRSKLPEAEYLRELERVLRRLLVFYRED